MLYDDILCCVARQEKAKKHVKKMDREKERVGAREELICPSRAASACWPCC